MNKFNDLKQFLKQFIKNKLNNKEIKFEEERKKKREEHLRQLRQKEHGKNDGFDVDDFIY